MKISVKAASGGRVVKVIYSDGLATAQPELRSMTVTRPDAKLALMDAIEHLEIPYLGYDFEEPDEFSIAELIDAIQYQNGSDVEADYIFLLEINGEAYIDNTAPEENY